MYHYKINQIIFNDNTQISPGSLTVIVGPNNGGKSRILKDLKALTTEQNPNPIVIKNLEFSLPNTVDELKSSYNIETFLDQNRNLYLRTLSSDLMSQHNVHVGAEWEHNLQTSLTRNDQNTRKTFSHWLGSFFVSLFETEERLKLTKESESSDRGVTHNLLQAFYREGVEVENKLREIIKEAFDKDIKLDYSSLRKLLFRIGDSLENAPTDPRDALNYYENIEKLDSQGDGLRSFVATLLVILIGKKSVLLLDEPESFLHPPQAYRLGEVIANHANSNRQIIVSTHSSEFLRGILSKTQNLSIIRIDRFGNSNNIKLLDSNQVASISTDPLLSSTRIMDGLFYKGAIVVEADADSIFYQRIARQLDRPDNFHITHAHNKQTVSKVFYPYRTLGIKFSAIVDFDIIRVKTEFQSLITQLGMSSADIEEALKLQEKIVKFIENTDPKQLLENQLNELETEIKRIRSRYSNIDANYELSVLSGNLKRIRESGSTWKRYKEQGIAALNKNLHPEFYKLSELCEKYGLFIVPVGELEGWLVPHGLPFSTKKSKWIVNALELIPKLKPNKENQPWNFLNKVFNYLNS